MEGRERRKVVAPNRMPIGLPGLLAFSAHDPWMAGASPACARRYPDLLSDAMTPAPRVEGER